MKTKKSLLKLAVLILLLITFIFFIFPCLIPIYPLENTVEPALLADKESHFVKVDDLNIHYKEFGEGAPVMILLHGFGASLFSWREVMIPLSISGTVFAYDRPAFGLTDRPEISDGSIRNPYPNSYQPELLIKFMDKMEIDTAILVGNSAGGTLAVQAAFDYPDRVTALILVSPALLTSGGTPKFLQSLFQLPPINHIGPLIARLFLSNGDSFLETAWHNPLEITSYIYEGYKLPLKANNWDKAFWEFVKSSKPIQLEDQLPGLSLPVLVITGDDDRIVPTSDSIKAAGLIPNAELVVIPECGHTAQEECPDQFLEAALNFLNRIGEKNE